MNKFANTDTAATAPVIHAQNRLKVRVTKIVEYFEASIDDSKLVPMEDISLSTIDEGGDPAETIVRRVEQLAELLGCSETEAQRVLLNY